MTKFTEEFKEMLAAITDKMNTLKSFPTQNNSTKPPDPTNVVPTNRRDPQLDGGQYTKIGGMWNLKHEISSTRFYGLQPSQRTHSLSSTAHPVIDSLGYEVS